LAYNIMILVLRISYKFLTSVLVGFGLHIAALY